MKKILIGSYLLIAATCIHAQKFGQLNKLIAADRASGNQLGSSVAISGNYAVVAAADVSFGQVQNSCQCVYVFEKINDNWTQKQKLFASDRTSGIDFGHSVAISRNYIIVGAPGDENNAGAVYVFLRNASGNWIQEKKLVANDRSAGDLFGTSVSITPVYDHGDGSYVLIGAPGDADFGTSVTGAGTAYFF